MLANAPAARHAPPRPLPTRCHRWLALLAGLAVAASAPATTFRVNSISDDGDQTPGDNICDIPAGGPVSCSLRAAIEEANAHAGVDIIEFDIGLVVISITGSPLPTITDHLYIDGRTAPGYNGAATDVIDAPPSFYISGHNLTGTTADGFRIDSNGGRLAEIHAIGIVSFPDNGIELVDGVVSVLDGNWIGVGRTGGVDGNGGDGVYLDTCDRCVVGRDIDGNPPVIEGVGNVISNNAGAGVYALLGDGNVIAGNHIGVDPVGTGDNGNGGAGVHLVSAGNVVGDFRGTAGGFLVTPNTIRNNGGDGVRIESGNNHLLSNIIRGNGGNGVSLNGGSSWVGGPAADTRNFIRENGGHGVVIGNAFASHSNLVRNARIWSNVGRGVQVTNGSNNVISNNEIFLNDNDGVRVDSVDNDVLNNRIGFLDEVVYGNAANGIVVAANGTVLTGNRIAGMADDGIDLFSGFGAQVMNNQVGSSNTGADWGNANAGIRIRAAAPNALVQGNVVGFNFNGVVVEATDTLVCGNRIGVGLGDQLAGNASEGLWLVGDGNVIGSDDGSCPANVIGDNGSDGIEVWGADNVIAGNRIGGVPGIDLGNHNGGILLHGAGAHSNHVLANVLWYNASDGVRVTATAGNGNAIQENSFGSNGGQGIDLLDDGPTANDPGDGDGGPNRLQNTPVITSAIGATGEVAVTFSVDSGAAAAAYPLAVDVYLTGPGTSQGGHWLQRESYASTDDSVTRYIPLPAGTATGGIIATATDADGNTSEFSNAMAFFAVPLPEELFYDGFED